MGVACRRPARTAVEYYLSWRRAVLFNLEERESDYELIKAGLGDYLIRIPCDRMVALELLTACKEM